MAQDHGLPITRTLYLTCTPTIDPPSSWLLAIHCAIARILHLSAVGDYIDKMLWDMEENSIRADGSTELGRFCEARIKCVVRWRRKCLLIGRHFLWSIRRQKSALKLLYMQGKP
jgi:hypothetical protein